MSLGDRRKQLIANLYFRMQRIPESPPTQAATCTEIDHLFADNLHSKPFGVHARDIIREIELPTATIIPEEPPPFPPWTLAKIAINQICSFGLEKRKSNYPPAVLKGMFNDHKDTTHRGTYHIYTDGSKSNEGVGVGVYASDFSLSLRLSNLASNYSAEIHAILEALENIDSENHGSITIFTDSLSSIQSIANMYSNNPIIKSIQAYLLQLSQLNKQVQFCWTPAHVGISGNEEADRLAKQGTTSNRTNNEAVAFRDIYPSIKSRIKQAWEARWSRVTGNKLRRIKDTTANWNTNFPNRRKLEVIICRLRIGHTRLTHGHYMERRTSNDCPQCDETPLSVEHVLCECPQYDLARLSHFGCRNPRLESILGRNLPVESLAKFLLDTGTFNDL